MRRGEITPIAFSLPVSTKFFDDGNWSKSASTWPPITSCIAGPEPLYGMWIIFTPEAPWKDSPSMWLMLPTPELAKEYLPGLAFTTAMNSFRFFAGKLGFAVRMFGIDAMLVIGMKSSSAYCGLGCAAGYTTMVLTVPIMSV